MKPQTKAELLAEWGVLRSMRETLLMQQDATPKSAKHLFDARIETLEHAIARVEALQEMPDDVAEGITILAELGQRHAEIVNWPIAYALSFVAKFRKAG